MNYGVYHVIVISLLKERMHIPTPAWFYGIVIHMYFLGSKYNLLHIHAIYGDDTAAFDSNLG